MSWASSVSPGSAVRTSVSPTLPGVTVTGPMRVGSPIFDKTLYGTNFNLSRVGYEKSQFFLSGTAHSYVPASPLTSDGRWKVTTSVTAPYGTRIAVYRPIDPKKFNGTVVVDGSMCPAGLTTPPSGRCPTTNWSATGRMVGVSAQQVGVDSAKTADPASTRRSHPAQLSTTSSRRPAKRFARTQR